MDEILLRKAKRGDPEAFGRLMEPLEQRIWRICWHYTGDREAASDCGQEAMLRVWRGLSSWRGDSVFETWVYRVAANCCLDWLRKKKRDRSESMEEMRDRGFDPADPAPGTEARVLAAEEQAQLREAIAALPEDQREALVLTQLEGVPYAEAAKIAGVSEGTVKSRVSRAREKLKELLGGDRELSGPENVRQREEQKERRRRS